MSPRAYTNLGRQRRIPKQFLKNTSEIFALIGKGGLTWLIQNWPLVTDFFYLIIFWCLWFYLVWFSRVIFFI